MAEKTATSGDKIMQLSGRVSQSVQEEFYRLKDEGGYETFSLFVEALIERYQNPVRINEKNQKKIEELTAKIEELESEITAQRDELTKKELQLTEQREATVKAAEEIEKLKNVNVEQAGRLEVLDKLENAKKNHILVPVTRLDELCLQYLCDRENRSRKRTDITPPVFYQYALQEMIIKGNKFSIDSVPDSVIDKFKKQISNE